MRGEGSVEGDHAIVDPTAASREVRAESGFDLLRREEGEGDEQGDGGQGEAVNHGGLQVGPVMGSCRPSSGEA